jgi:SAM-dependent methyltransferase
MRSPVVLDLILIFFGVHRRSSVVNRFCGVAAGLALAAGAALAQPADVVYVPTPQPVVDRMLQMARVGEHDFVIDLGAGDGRILITAARRYGARGFGVDTDPERVREANAAAARAGVAEKVRFAERNLFEQDIRGASVVALYLMPEVNIRLRPKLLAELRPGARVVSHDYHMGDWFPDTTLTVESPGKVEGTPGVSEIYVWVIPAAVSGKWSFRAWTGGAERKGELALVQRYQHIGGALVEDGHKSALREAKLSGEQITFALAGAEGAKLAFSGRVAGNQMRGAVRDAQGRTVGSWLATRTTPVESADPNARRAAN